MKNTSKRPAWAVWTTTAALMVTTVLGAACASSPDTLPVHALVVPDGHVEGADLYRQHCQTCHDLYDPNRYTDFQWSWIMPQMAREANLDKRRAAKIEAYVKAAND